MDQQRLLELEERFWKGKTDFYRANVLDDALMVFPEPTGVLDKDEAVDATERSERWSAVEFQDVKAIGLGGGVSLLVYKAHAARGKGSTYSTLASSVYVERDGSVLLAFHQQTPS
jgi:hypothetical protein